MTINGKQVFVAAAINATGLLTMQAAWFMLKSRMPFGAYVAVATGTGILLSVNEFRKAFYPLWRSQFPCILPADEHQLNADDLQDVPAENAAAENVLQDVPAENAAAENFVKDLQSGLQWL